MLDKRRSFDYADHADSRSAARIRSVRGLGASILYDTSHV